MANHMLRGAITAWMGLIVLNTVGSAGGSSKIAAAFGDLDTLITHALSSTVPAIPDRRNGGRGTAIAGPDGSGADGTHGYIDPRGRYIPPSDTTIPQPNPPQTSQDAYTTPYAPSLPTLI